MILKDYGVRVYQTSRSEQGKIYDQGWIKNKVSVMNKIMFDK